MKLLNVLIYLLVGAALMRKTLFTEIRNDHEAAGFVAWILLWPIATALYFIMTLVDKE